MWLNEESLFNKKRNYSSLAEVPNEELTTKSAFETLELTTQRDYTNCCYYYFFNFLNIPSISVYHLDFTFWTLIILPFKFNISGYYLWWAVTCTQFWRKIYNVSLGCYSHFVAVSLNGAQLRTTVVHRQGLLSADFYLGILAESSLLIADVSLLLCEIVKW